MFAFRTSATLVFVGLLLSGCSSKPSYQEADVYPVSGSVSVNGKPAAGVIVVFHPQTDTGMTKGNKPYTTTGEDGTFQVTTYVTGDGAPAGEYIVTLIWPVNPRGPSPDRLKGRYAKPEQSEIKVTIQEGENNLPKWEL
ncbi:hypothetical protein [Thalassoroseus pseudoceratinae]|uniref:hypothetical protein n=1 Tax=Thalassoroseus pseudoceratinae TaxID=2713176 RepID=UPI001422827B|nr:hypothetical protein [Thalassoroseus pseudoceratinae]